MVRMTRILILCLVPFGCGATDDGDNSVGPDATAVSASCQEATEHSDLEWIQENILSTSCAAFNACHKGAALSAGGLNLESGTSEAAMLNTPSSRFPSFDLVVPGDPSSSYLMIIIGGEDGPIDPSVGTMPFNSPPLCDDKIDAIRRWIASM